MKDERGTFLVPTAPPVCTEAPDEPIAEPLGEPSQEPHADYTDEGDQTRGFSNKGIFRRPFSFSGRIRRREYVATYVIYLFWYLLLVPGDDAASSDFTPSDALFLLTFVPVLWFYIAQSCKRCHDLGHSGWWQLIPYYFVVLLFSDSDRGDNEYGDCPKEEGATRNPYL